MKLISKVTEIYCIADDFCKEYELEFVLSVESTGKCKIRLFEELCFWCFKHYFFLGLLFIFFCMIAIFLSVTSSKLACFGIYCLMSLYFLSSPFAMKHKDLRNRRRLPNTL